MPNIESLIEWVSTQYNLKPYDLTKSYVKYKPLNDLERTLLVDVLNNYLFAYLKLDNLVARKTGKSTVDILTTNNDKLAVFKHLNLDNCNTLYIGDEVDKGNDQFIASSSNKHIRISGVRETTLLLKLLTK